MGRWFRWSGINVVVNLLKPIRGMTVSRSALAESEPQLFKYVYYNMYYVYILKWDRYYCWSTNNLKRRLLEHRRWKTITTKTFEIYDLVWYYVVNTYEEARELEKKIKRSGHIERWTLKDGFLKVSNI